ncbi:MAG: ferrous iron transport protein A [Chloroflexi bacterium]|jgi:ferrous iron transport protein A|nr:ferrous iron transport protein A [Chloroflexota bacterium]
MPLSLAPAGQLLRLVSIQGGLGVQKRLTALGLTPGTEVMVISQSCDGPIILAVKDSRLALGRGLLHHIQVEPQDGLVGDAGISNGVGGPQHRAHRRMHGRFGHHH